jgi:hypothetical protein
MKNFEFFLEDTENAKNETNMSRTYIFFLYFENI